MFAIPARMFHGKRETLTRSKASAQQRRERGKGARQAGIAWRFDASAKRRAAHWRELAVRCQRVEALHHQRASITYGAPNCGTPQTFLQIANVRPAAGLQCVAAGAQFNERRLVQRDGAPISNLAFRWTSCSRRTPASAAT